MGKVKRNPNISHVIRGRTTSSGLAGEYTLSRITLNTNGMVRAVGDPANNRGVTIDIADIFVFSGTSVVATGGFTADNGSSQLHNNNN